MDIIKKILEYSDHWTHPDAQFTASQIASGSNYQLYLHRTGVPRSVPIKLENKVNASIGTGYHMRMEQALEDEDCLTEHKMFCNIGGVNVSGTADIIYDNGFVSTVGDVKTMGMFPMIKMLDGEIDKFVRQLSIYAYMYGKEIGNDMETVGEIYAFRTGDNKRLSKAEAERYPEGIPRYKTLQIDLMEEEEVELMVKEAANAYDDGAKSCQKWLCNWCEFSCTHRKN